MILNPFVKSKIVMYAKNPFVWVRLIILCLFPENKNDQMMKHFVILLCFSSVRLSVTLLLMMRPLLISLERNIVKVYHTCLCGMV